MYNSVDWFILCHVPFPLRKNVKLHWYLRGLARYVCKQITKKAPQRRKFKLFFYYILDPHSLVILTNTQVFSFPSPCLMQIWSSSIVQNSEGQSYFLYNSSVFLTISTRLFSMLCFGKLHIHPQELCVNRSQPIIKATSMILFLLLQFCLNAVQISWPPPAETHVLSIGSWHKQSCQM